jgi:hypothetical protein
MDSTAAHDYIVGPLNDAEPVDETGLNTTFRSTFAPNRHGTPSNVPAPLACAPPRRRASNPAPYSPPAGGGGGGSSPRRARGRTVHHPRRRPASWVPGADTIDRLDAAAAPAGGGRYYHHGGPFDASLLAANAGSPATSPVAALAGSNAAALRATPRERVVDAIERRRPLDGVADVACGGTDRFGRWYDYSEINLMVEGEGGQGMMPGEVSAEIWLWKRGADLQVGDGKQENKGRFREAESSDDIPPQSPKWVGVEQDESDEEPKSSLRRNSIRGLKKIIALGRKVSVSKKNHD